MIKEQFYKNKISWQKSFMSGFCVDDQDNEVPWMTYPMIEFLKTTITKNHEVFEFGCGASTLFFARNAKNVTSIETNKIWQNIVTTKLAESELKNSQIFLDEDGINNDDYQKYPQILNKKFDVIIIDSIKRFDCSINSIKSLKENGFVILDDSERYHYKKIFNFFAENGFKQRDFLGIAPAQLRIKNSTIFYK